MNPAHLKLDRDLARLEVMIRQMTEDEWKELCDRLST